jgi:hypothetical protein
LPISTRPAARVWREPDRSGYRRRVGDPSCPCPDRLRARLAGKTRTSRS